MTYQIDFTKISDGEEFEDLCEDLLKAMGFNVFQPERSGRGPDGGKDIIATEMRYSSITDSYRKIRWIVQCKNNSKANMSVKPSEINGIMDRIIRHNCDGYLLMTSTIPSTDLEQNIHSIDNDPKTKYEATFWAKNRLSDEILKHRLIYEKYFGAPSKNNTKIVNWKQRNPFIELYSYEESLASYFFGREDDTKKLTELVYRENEVLLYGESGVGKSSLLDAGLLPLLKKDGVLVTRINTQPGIAIKEILADTTIKEIFTTDIPSNIKEAFSYIASTLRKEERRLVIYFDQFETLFSGTIEDQNRFGEEFNQILETIRKFRTITLLISLRSDYLEKIGLWLATHKISKVWNNAYPLQKFSAAQAREILDNVPKLVDADFSEKLINQIISDLNEFDKGEIYPVNLQIVATRIFEEGRKLAESGSKSLSITENTYKDLGGAKDIIESFINDKLQNFTDKEVAEKILLSFVSSSGRRLSLSSIDLAKKVFLQETEIIPVIDRMVEARLIRPLNHPNTFELVHDFLAIKLFHGLDEDKRKEKIAKDSFDIAFQAWKSEGVLESVSKTDYFYQYRNSLNINEHELFFIIYSIINHTPEDQFGYTRIYHAEDRLRISKWLGAISSKVTSSSFLLIIELLNKDGLSSTRFAQFLSEYAFVPDLELQKFILSCLDIVVDAKKKFFIERYERSTIPNAISLKTIQEIYLNTFDKNQKELISLRLTTSLFKENPISSYREYLFYIEGDEERTAYLQTYDLLFSDHDFRKYIAEYINKNKLSPFEFSLVLNLLNKHDRDAATTVAQERIRQHTEAFGIIRGGGLTDFREIAILYPYDKDATMNILTNSLASHSTRFLLSKSALDLLGNIDDPRINQVFIEVVQSHLSKFHGGSNMWTGRSKKHDYSLLQTALKHISSRKILEAVPLIEEISTSAEPNYIIDDCITCLLAIDANSDSLMKTNVRLLDDKSQKLASKAKSILEKQIDKHEEIVSYIKYYYSHNEMIRYGKKRIITLLKKINTARSLELANLYKTSTDFSST